MDKVLILDFITSLGGVQSVEKNIIKKIKKKVDLFFLDPYENKEFNKELEQIRGIKILKLKIYPTKCDLGWDKLYKKLFIFIILGPAYLLYIIRLGILLRKKNINILYVHSKKSLIVALILKSIFKVEYYYHAHGFGDYKDIGILFKIAIKRSKKIFVVSKDVLEKLLKARIKKKIYLVYNGIDIEEINIKSKEKINLIVNKDELNIVSVSSLHEGKGIHNLIKAVNNLLSKKKKVKLFIIGDIPNKELKDYKDKLTKLSKEQNSDKIVFLGWKKNPYKYIEKFDVLALPSNNESFGMVLIEAMALKKIVIGSEVGGILEIIEDNVNGFLIKKDDVKSIEEKLNFILENLNYMTEIANKGYLKVKREFSIKKQVEKIVKVMEEK